MRLSAFAATLALAAFAPTHAATLPGDGSWAGFTVDGNLPPYSLNWVDDNGAPLSFDFVVPAGFVATLTVVDTGFSGDRFFVYDGSSFLGETGAAVNGDVSGPIQFSYDEALADAAFSRGVFTLGAGSHSILGVLSQSTTDAFGPLNATIGGVRLTVSPVPEPAAWGVLLLGLGVVMGALRRRAR